MDNKKGVIIQAVEQCLRRNGCSSCENCPYTYVGDGFECREKLRDDIIALLKAQDNTICTKERCPVNANSISDDCNVRTCPWRTEAVVPKVSMSGLWYECPVCHGHLTKHEDHYCSRCGKRVKWDG